MQALCLLILSAIVYCGVGYTIVERPAKVDENQLSYNRIPSGVVQSRPPVGFWFQQHPYNLPKPESQALFELYYLIQVITIYRRHHPRAHRSHLDALVEELQDDGFQQKIRQALKGIKELDVLQAYADLNLQDYAPFVNDRRQLIPAIHRTLNEIQLGQIKDKELRWTLERLKEESTALTVKMARKEAEVLRELIESNRKLEKAWTVSDILAAVFGKQDNEDTMKDFEQKYEVVDDGKPIDDGKVEEFWVVFEDDKREEAGTKAPSNTTSAEPETKPFQFIDDNYEQYEAKQEVEAEVKEESAEQSPEQISESKQVDEPVTVDQSLEQDSEPKEEVEVIAEADTFDEPFKAIAESDTFEENLEQETAIESADSVVEGEDVEESVKQESVGVLDGEQRIESDGFEFKEQNYERSELEDEEQDFERTVPEEDDQGLIEEVVVEEELPDPIPEDLQTLDVSVETVEISEPEYTENVEEELQSLEDSVKTEDQAEPQYTEELEEELQNLDGPLETEQQPEPVYIQEVEGNLQSLDGSEDPEPEPELSEELVEEIPEPAAAKTAPDSITFPDDPQWVEDSVRPVGSSAAAGLDSDQPSVLYNMEEVESPVTQSVPLWISKGITAEYEGREVVEEEAFQREELQEFDTNELESRAEPTEKVEIDQETLRYVAFEILKVVSLLEDSAGFTGLRDQITNEDVDRLIEQLSVEQFVSLIDDQGINRIEMINALERLVVEKNLENSGEIVAVLEQWKQGEEAQLVKDGYFSESYGKAGGVEDEVESRMLEVEEVTSPDEAQDLEQLVGEPESESQLQFEDSENTLEELEPQSESVPEMKSNGLVEDVDAEVIDDGYFAEKYGNSEDVAESRTLDDDQLLEESQLVVVTPDEAQDAVQLVDELEGELKGDVELQVEESETLDEVAAESKSVQDLKSGDLVEDAELLNDSPELVEDASDISESISQIEESSNPDDQKSKNLQPFPEEVTEDTQPLEGVQREVEEKKLQPFPEEVTEETVPVVQVGDLNSKMLAPFPDQVLDEVQPLKVALGDQLDQLEPFPDQIMNVTQPFEIAQEDQLNESTSDVDNPKIEPVSNRPFPATPTGRSEPLEVARASTDEGALGDEDRREILEDLHSEP